MTQQKQIQNNLAGPVSALPGIGPKKEKLLNKNNLYSIGDILNIAPKNFLLIKPDLPISDFKKSEEDNLVVLVGKIVSFRFSGYGRSKKFEAALENNTGQVILTFFNTGFINTKQVYAVGNELTVCGKIKFFGQTPQIIHPKVLKGSRASELTGIKPLYIDYSFIRSTALEKLIHTALKAVNNSLRVDQKEYLDKNILEQHNMLALNFCYFAFHMPEPEATEEALFNRRLLLTQAKNRLALEELVNFQKNLDKKRREKNLKKAHNLQPNEQGPTANQLFQKLFDFRPTNAQIRVIVHILQDFSKNHTSNRVIQGDVGSGKTAVAACAMLQTALSGFQAALMAPTQILATQHYENLAPIFEQLGFESVLITSYTKKYVKSKYQNSKIFQPIIFGTHALISEQINFEKLALAIIDEQHRFGVEQRNFLQEKYRNNNLYPHLILMSATPIPRSLAMTLYGDLDISVIDELPAGRQKINTHIIKGDTNSNLKKILDKIKDAKEKAYVIYPLIEESEKLDLQNAIAGHDYLQNIYLDNTNQNNIFLVHGKIKVQKNNNLKNKIILDFKNSHGFSVLVSTTVVEVGVDVPDATNMIIVHPERFGLAQLHQLRGRVGRSSLKSRCYLLAENFSPRLKILAQTQDGFKIADEDLKLRGPGDFLGKRQSGLPEFKFFNFAEHGELVNLSKDYN